MQKIFSLDTYLGPFLMSYLNKYVKLRDDQFQLSLWGGDVVLNHVELQHDILEHLIPLPIGFKSGQVHELRIQVPWTRLGSSSIVITLNTVECVLAFKPPGPSSYSKATNFAPPSMTKDVPSGYLQSYLSRIWSNIEVIVNNLIIKFVEDDIVMSVNIRSLDCFPTNINWERGIPLLLAKDNYCLHRLLRVTDVTCCMDQCNPTGHIVIYQEPIIYRCSFDIRMQTVFSQNSVCCNNGLASICLANILCSDLMLNINQVQLPLLARMVEILLALTNGILDWDTLSTNQLRSAPTEIVSEDQAIHTENSEESWKNWAWSFVPSVLQGSSTSIDPDDEVLSDNDQVDVLDEVGASGKELEYSDACAEYLRLIYVDATCIDTPPVSFTLDKSREELKSSTNKRQQNNSKHRRWRIRRLRKYQQPVPALVLGALILKCQINLKILDQSASKTSLNSVTRSSSDYSSQHRRNCLSQTICRLNCENACSKFVQNGINFSSFQAGFQSLNVMSTGEQCPCGFSAEEKEVSDSDLHKKRKSSFAALVDEFTMLSLLSSKEQSTCVGFNSLSLENPLLEIFCGLFSRRNMELTRSQTTPNLLHSSNNPITDIKNASERSFNFSLSPLTRRDYHALFGEDREGRIKALGLALFFDTVISRETEYQFSAANEDDDPIVPNVYSFGRLLFGQLEFNLSCGVSHQLQCLLNILVEGSRNYKPCSNWAAIDVLPPQEPVDSWGLNDRILLLKKFIATTVFRIKLSSFYLHIFPPTHDATLLNRLSRLCLQTGPVEMLFSCPKDSAYLVFTLNHLHPSTGVLEDLSQSFLSIVDTVPSQSEYYWGTESQVAGAYGYYHPQPTITTTTTTTMTTTEDDRMEMEDDLSRENQVRLLSACYSRQYFYVSDFKLGFIHSGGIQEELLAPLGVRIIQRRLLYPSSWPDRLRLELVTKESHIRVSPVLDLKISPSSVRLLGAFIPHIWEDVNRIAVAVFRFSDPSANLNQPTVSPSRFSKGDICYLFKHRKESNHHFDQLAVKWKGDFVGHSSEAPKQDSFSVTLTTSFLVGTLFSLKQNSLFPFLEGRHVLKGNPKSSNFFSIVCKRNTKYLSSMTFDLEGVNILLTKTLFDWITETIDSFGRLLHTCIEERTQPISASETDTLRVSEKVSSHDKPVSFVVDRTNKSFEFQSPAHEHCLPNFSQDQTNFISLWIVENCNFICSCKLNINIQSWSLILCTVDLPNALDSALYFHPETASISIFTDFFIANPGIRQQTIEITLPKITLKGPRFSSPSASTQSTPKHETFTPRSDIHLYSFDFEQQESAQKPIVSQSQPTSLTSLMPAWTILASSTSMLVGSETRLAGGDISITCSLVFSSTIIKPETMEHNPGRLDNQGTGPSIPPLALINDSECISAIACQLFCHANGFSMEDGQHVEKLSLEHIRLCIITAMEIGLMTKRFLIKVGEVRSIASRFLSMELRLQLKQLHLDGKHLVQPVVEGDASTTISKIIYAPFLSSTVSTLSSSVSGASMGYVSAPQSDFPTFKPHIKISFCLQGTLSSVSGECVVIDDKNVAIVWEIEGLTVTANSIDNLSVLQIKLDRLNIALRTPERTFPLITRKHEFLKPCQEFNPCPGSKPSENHSPIFRPQPPCPDAADADGYGDFELKDLDSNRPRLSVDERTGVFRLSCIRTGTLAMRKVFAGKRFSDWVDLATENFLLGRISSDKLMQNSKQHKCDGLPFINCIYAQLAPLDVIICPGIMSRLHSFCVEINVLLEKIMTTGSQTTVKRVLKPVLNFPPGHCIPLLFFAADNLRVFLPSTNILSQLSPSCDTLAAAFASLRLHPFPVNQISRPMVPQTVLVKSHIRNQSSTYNNHYRTMESEIGAAREDRQHLFILDGLSIFAVNLADAIHTTMESQRELSLSEKSIFSKPILIGQCPAFEWNHAATEAEKIKDTVWVLPVLHPVNVTMALAAPICESNLIKGRQRVLAGIGIEVNASTDIIITLCAPIIMRFISSLISEVSNTYPTIDIQSPKPDSSTCQPLVAALPTRVLLTGGLVRLVVWSDVYDSEVLQPSLYADHNTTGTSLAVTIDVIQPHMVWNSGASVLKINEEFEFGLNDLQVYSRKVDYSKSSISVQLKKTQTIYWKNSVLWWITGPPNGNLSVNIPTYIPLPNVTQSNLPFSPNSSTYNKTSDPKFVGMPLREQPCFYTSSAANAGLLLARFKRGQVNIEENTTDKLANSQTHLFNADVCVNRDIVFNLTPSLLINCRHLVSVMTAPNTSIAQPRPVRLVSPASSCEHWLAFLGKTLAAIVVSTRSIQIIMTNESEPDERKQLQAFCGSLGLEIRFNNLHDWSLVKMTFSLQPIRVKWAGCPNFNFIRTDLCISGKLTSQISSPMPDTPITDIQLSMVPYLSVFLPMGHILDDITHLLDAFKMDCLKETTNKTNLATKNVVFYDDLRRNRNYTFSYSQSRKLPKPYTGIFFDGNVLQQKENKTWGSASMTWAYPEPRQIIRLAVMPVPLAYEFKAPDGAQVQVPCILQYWDELTDQFVDHATFTVNEEAKVEEAKLPLVVDIGDANRFKRLQTTQLTKMGGGISWGGEHDLEGDEKRLRENLDALWKCGDFEDTSSFNSKSVLPASSADVCAQIWRILIHFQAKLDGQFCRGIEIDESCVFPVQLSPSALAACVHIDSAFSSQLITKYSLRISVDYLTISVHQVYSQNDPKLHFPSINDFELLRVIANRTRFSSMVSLNNGFNQPAISLTCDDANVWLFQAHWAHLQLLAEVKSLGLANLNRQFSLASHSLHVCCSRELVYSLAWLLQHSNQASRKPPGWTIINNTAQEFILEQYLPCHMPQPDTKGINTDAGDDKVAIIGRALQTVHRMSLQPGEGIFWRPIRLPILKEGVFASNNPLRIAIRIGRPCLSFDMSKPVQSSLSCIDWSRPLVLVWPPAVHPAGATVTPRRSSIAMAVRWEQGEDARSERDNDAVSVSSMSLLVYPSPSASFPGQVILQSGIEIHNLLPLDLNFRLLNSKDGLTIDSIKASSHLLIIPPVGINSKNFNLMLSLLGIEEWRSVNIDFASLYAQTRVVGWHCVRQLIWLPTVKGIPSYLQIIATAKLERSDNFAPLLVKIYLSPAIQLINKLPSPICITSLSNPDDRFLSSNTSSSETCTIDGNSLRPVLLSMIDSDRISWNFSYSDGTAVFEGPLQLSTADILHGVKSLPTNEDISGNSFSVVLRPWLKLHNQSGINLQCSTWAGPIVESHNWANYSVTFSNGADLMPSPGARLFKLGVSRNEELFWSQPLLVHKSVFNASYSASPAQSSASSRNLTVSYSSPSYKLKHTSSSATFPASSLNLLSLRVNHPVVSVCIAMRNTVCCLSVRLEQHVDEEDCHPPVIIIEPLIQFINRSEEALLCKPIVTPNIKRNDVDWTIDEVDCDHLDRELMSLPPDSYPSTTLFWNFSHPTAVDVAELVELHLAHILVLRSHRGVFWSRSLRLLDLESILGIFNSNPVKGETIKTEAEVKHCYHMSLPTYTSDGDMDELSLIISVCKDKEKGNWMLTVDKWNSSLTRSIACNFLNKTSMTLDVFFTSPPETDYHRLAVSGALPRLHPNGGRLVVVPQSCLNRFTQSSISSDEGQEKSSTNYYNHSSILLDQSASICLCSGETSCVLDLQKLTEIGSLSLNELGVDAHLSSCSLSQFLVFIIISSCSPQYVPKKSHQDLSILAIPISLHIDSFSMSYLSTGQLWQSSHIPMHPREFLRLTVQCIKMVLLSHQAADDLGSFRLIDLRLNSSLIQIDNRAHSWSGLFDFPVLLRSSLLSAAPSAIGGGAFSLTLRFCPSYMHCLQLHLPHFEAFVEDTAVYAILFWSQDMVQLAALLFPVDASSVGSETPLLYPICIRSFNIHEISLQVALKASVGVHLSCKSTQLRLSPFRLASNSRVIGSPSSLISQLGTHYLAQALYRAGLVLGGLELIGNPVGLVAAFAAGLSDLVHFADSNRFANDTGKIDDLLSRQQRIGLLRGFAAGLKSLAKHTTGGVCNSLTGLAANFARNLHDLSLDSEHIRRTANIRQQWRPQGLVQGFSYGLSELGISLLGGLAGVAHHPLQALMESFPVSAGQDDDIMHATIPSLGVHDGVSNSSADETLTEPDRLNTQTMGVRATRMAGAVVAGLGKGLLGVVTKPLAGAADLVALTGMGFMHGMGAGWGVSPPASPLGSLFSIDDRVFVDSCRVDRWAKQLSSTLIVNWHGIAAYETELLWLALSPASDCLYMAQIDALGVVFGDVFPMPLVKIAARDEKNRLFSLLSSLDIKNNNTFVLLPGDKAMLFYASSQLSKSHRPTPVSLTAFDSDVSSPHQIDRVKSYLFGLPT